MAAEHDDEATRREGAVPRRAEPAGARDAEPHLTRGTLVGRYVVLDVLGEGGMGVVYNGYDPELDRKVAIKLLQTGATGTSGSEEAWLLREAQALARLSHPNVVAVHDVGTLPGDRVFVAMELVEGQTLRAWLKKERPSWREVVHVMTEAGAGLAAAHRAHLVHRDFKPDNVLVGADGRARVMDFGLARLHHDDAVDSETSSRSPFPLADGARSSDLHIDARSPLTEELTTAGTVVGTPAYMAPELFRGSGADARSDQFAFGVALFEALYRARPYSKEDLRTAAEGVAGVKPREPAPDQKSKVPAAIQRVVLKAIALEPDQRYPSMDALLVELAIDPAARRRKLLYAAGVVVTTLAIVGGTLVVSRSSATADIPCKGIDHRLAGVWDAAVKKDVRAAYDASKRPFAAQAYSGLERALDGYASRWVAMSTESCEATRVRRDQTEEVLALRQACLDDKLEELHALTQILAHADKTLVDKGDAIAYTLEEQDSVSKCADVAALKAPGEPPPALKATIVRLDKRVSEIKAQLIAAQYLPALVGAQQVYDEAIKLQWHPTIALALAMRGGALMATGNFDDGLALYRESVYEAIRGRRDDIAADAAYTAALLASEGKRQVGEARVWLNLGDAMSSRVGADRTLAIKRLSIEALIADAAGDIGGGVAAQDKAYEQAVRMYGPDDPHMMTMELATGGTLMRAGAWGKALTHLEKAIKLREASVGKDHPDIALMLSDLGACYRHEHQLDKAKAAFERSLAIRESFYGKNSPMLIATLDNYGEYLREVGDMTAALASMERARKLAFIVPGPTNEIYHQLLTDYADTYVAAGMLPNAKKMFDDALALEEQNKSPILPITQTSRAELALVEHAWAEAATLAQKAVAAFEVTGGKDNPALWRPLTALAKAKIGQGKPAEARPLLQRAIAIGEKAQVDASDLAPARTALTTLP
jgi:tetratricopeptide (TPR) repeat protein